MAPTHVLRGSRCVLSSKWGDADGQGTHRDVRGASTVVASPRRSTGENWGEEELFCSLPKVYIVLRSA